MRKNEKCRRSMLNVEKVYEIVLCDKKVCRSNDKKICKIVRKCARSTEKVW